MIFGTGDWWNSCDSLAFRTGLPRFALVLKIAGMTPVAPILGPAVVAAFRSCTLTADQAEAILPRDRLAFNFFFVQVRTALASPAPAGGAHTPPGTVPPYAKPAASPDARNATPYTATPAPHAHDPSTSTATSRTNSPPCGAELTRTGRTCTRHEPAGVKVRRPDVQPPPLLVHGGDAGHEFGRDLRFDQGAERRRRISPTTSDPKSSSERGAATRGVLMSVCQTVKNRGLDTLHASPNILRTYATSGALPPLR
jgi:hypothetical protein